MRRCRYSYLLPNRLLPITSSPIHTNYRAKVQRIFDMTKLFLIIEVFFAFLAQEFGYMQKKLYLCRLKLC